MSLLENVYKLLPTNYGNDYRQISTPYHLQNLYSKTIDGISDLFVEKLNSTISFEDGLQWLQLSNRETAPDSENLDNMFKFTLEYEYLQYYLENLKRKFEVGNRKVVDVTFEVEGNFELINTHKYKYQNPESNILKIFPQYEMVWNKFLQKFVLIWYTPVTIEGDILSYSEARRYLNSLYECSNYLLADDEKKKIILKVDDELGFSLIDTLTYSRYLKKEIFFGQLTKKINTVYEKAERWVEQFNERLITFYYMKNRTLNSIETQQEQLNHYLFIDEDLNFFDNTTYSYFTFKITDNYYEDLVGGAGTNLKYWQPDTQYKQGDCVVRDILFPYEGRNLSKKVIYKCLINLEPQETFQDKISLTNEETGEEEEVIAWEPISNELGDEEFYIKVILDNPKFDPSNYYRFVFPSIEQFQEPIILPNGEYSKNIQEAGFLAYSANYVLYGSPYLNKDNTIEYNDKYLTNSKVVCYIKKPKKKQEVDLSIVIQFDEQSTGVTLAPQCFYNRQDLTKIVLGKNIKYIGNESFYNCTNLKHCILSEGLRTLGARAFASCSSLARVSLPNGIRQLENTYCGCTNLITVILGTNTKILGDCTFKDCINLRKIYNLSQIEKLGREVFANCRALTEITIPLKVTRLENRLFYDCENLAVVIENQNITYLGEGCFENCKKITKTIDLSKLTSLQPRSYKGCVNLKEVKFDFSNFPIDQRKIPEKFCQGCTNLRKIQWAILKENELEENLNQIEDERGPTVLQESCFKNCGSLTKIRIPDTVVDMELYVFADCLNLKEISIPQLFRETEKSNWEEMINMYTDRISKNNWFNTYLTKVIIRKDE